ncbi:MAG: NADH-quinone oxidoreductase subunit N [Holophaga sp.]|nr:NADH-quinone oxidoreductase subunit N [Holophaga sp.]
MTPTPAQLAAIMPLLIPALGACLLPIASLDSDQATVKWIRASMFFIALLALTGAFFHLTHLWATGAQPGFGALRMDRLAQFGGIFVLVAAAMAVLQLWDHLHQEGWVKGETLSLLLFSVTGMILFCATGNLLLLFLALELLSLPLYALTASVRMREQAMEGGMKYFITGAVASASFLMGSVLLYGATGSLDITVIGTRLALGGALDPVALAGAALLLLGFLFKMSVVPFHQWTPDVYEAAPHPIAGFMSVATKGVALLALMRVMAVALPAVGPQLRSALAVLAVCSLVLGNLAALAQTSIKRMLAYSSISHAGYLLLGFVAATPGAYAGMLFYLLAYLAMNMGAFGMLSAFGLVGEKASFDGLRGLGWKRPGLGIAVSLCMISLAGLPPMAGFYGKYMIFKELILQGHVGLAVVGVLASLVSVYYYLAVPVALFMGKPSEQQEREAAEQPAVVAPLAGATVLICGFLVLAMGLIPGTVMIGFAQRAAQDTLGLLP